VGKGLGRNLCAAQHSGNFLNASFGFEPLDTRYPRLLVNVEVVMPLGCNLPEVGNHQNLRMGA
jgi:hypothetical protein